MSSRRITSSMLCVVLASVVACSGSDRGTAPALIPMRAQVGTSIPTSSGSTRPGSQPSEDPSDLPAPGKPTPTTLDADFVGRSMVTASGHVVFLSHPPDAGTDSVLFDWDPAGSQPPRRVPLSRPLSDVFFLGTTRFVVAYGAGNEARSLELWDATTLRVVRRLAGTWKANGDLRVEGSADGGRGLVLACPNAGAGCIASSYALTDGALLHSTKTPPLADPGAYARVAHLSPAGKFFAVGHPHAPTEVRAAETGKVVYTEPKARLGDYDATRSEFLDEAHLFVSRQDGRILQVMDLPSGRGVATVDYSGRVRDQYEALGYTMAPDRKHVVTLLKREQKVAVWDLSSAKEHTYPIDAVCAECDVRWEGTDGLLVRPRSKGADPKQLRVDLVQQTARVQPYEEVPILSSGGFRVYADSFVVASNGMATEKRRAPGAGAPTRQATLSPPKGTRVELGDLTDSSLAVAAGSLFLVGHRSIRQFARDGAVRELRLVGTLP